MSFLAPLFLAALAALAIPVLIHLVQRERRNVVRFPSLMFLRRIPYSSIRRRRIQHWSLLLLRLAALALIVAAFARPFFPDATSAASIAGAREIVILLDRSYSMGHGTQWERARQAARDVVAGMTGDDRATLVRFAESAEVAAPATGDRSRLQAAIDASELSSAGTRFGPALKLAGSLLAASSSPRREVVLISDFQRSAWSPGDGLRLPAGTILTTVPVMAPDARNVAVAPVHTQRERADGQERVVITATVLNRSDRPVADLPVVLEIDGHESARGQVTLEPHGAATVVFPPVVLTSPNTRASVRVPDDDLAADNAFHAVLSPPQPVPVALVHGTAARSRAALHLVRALGIGDAPRFEVATTNLGDLSDGVLAGARVVLLNDVSPPEAAVARLAAFVQNGGGLLVAFGPQATWPQGAADLLPAVPGAVVDRTRGPAGVLGGLEYGHAVFEPFRAPRSGDFSAARFYGYRRMSVAEGADVLARFDDGAPALASRMVGRGRVLAWASTLDLFWSDLVLKPVFLPFVHQMVRYLADYRERRAWASVGEVIDYSEVGDASRARVALAPRGARVTLDGEEGQLLEVTEPGFYEIREQDRQARLVAVTAVNVELAESDRSAVDPREIAVAVGGDDGPSGIAAAPEPLPLEAQERAQGIWWYLLLAGILLLIGESVLAHRLSRAS